MQIINKINGTDESQVIFSFEYFTPKYPRASTADAKSKINDDFISKVKHMASYGASYCDITWRPSSADMSVDLASRMQAEVPVDTMMHLTCLGMSMEKINKAIDSSKEKGVANIMALRGDPPVVKTTAGAAAPGGDESREVEKGVPVCGLDLVEHIRLRHGDFFGLAVAGYPDENRGKRLFGYLHLNSAVQLRNKAHPEKIPEGSEIATQEAYEEDLVYLKRKVDAGADFIVTQLFFDTSIFLKFVSDCRRVGIKCPIVPGILPIVSYRSFQTMTTTCRTKVPTEIRNKVESLKLDEPALLAYGVDLAAEMCTEILQHGIRELHFYTMNRDEPVMKILQRLGLLKGGENGVVPRVLAVEEEKEEKKVAYGAI